MAGCSVSIVVPTFREAKNIPLLCQQINDVLVNTNYSYEIIIADDDSQDGTVEACKQLVEQDKLPVRLLTRTTNRGLSPAVLDGIEISQGEIIVVMDADLSHPPAKIPELVDLLATGEAKFVVGSRYVAGGQLDKNWPLWRRINSWVATVPALFLVPVNDPMSGFFGLRRADVPPMEQLSPLGYKIGLELCVKGGFSRADVREISITFSDRQHGESKMNFKQQVLYLRHLRRLYHHRFPKRMELFQFIGVGSCGVVVDLFFYLSLMFFNVPHVIARGISYWPAVTFNWFFNRKITFQKRPKQSPFKQWAQYATSSGFGFLLNWGTYTLLTHNFEFFETYLLLAFVCGILVGTVFNFLMSSRVIFKH